MSNSSPTMLEHLGGAGRVHEVVAEWYPAVLSDPLLHPLFGDGAADHVPHLTAFLVEVFGGATDYTDRLGGFPELLAHHRGLDITEEQRQRFVDLFMAAADRVGLPDDSRFRNALLGYLEFGTEIAKQNSQATTDAELHECQVVPRWVW